MTAETETAPERADGRDYETVYADDWRHIVENPDGTLNPDQVKRELHDYSTLLRQVPVAYDEATGGRLSKPHTLPCHIADAVNERLDKAAADAINDLIKSLEAGPGDSFASVADVVGLIRELTGVDPE
jgi:hypothetical protein